ncbi:cytochrome P450 [Actinophytocola xanthii]|uniref:Cytochrome P450 n=1 Tax=Actinophytocola xanthii TaxID=1912961 RepID=A0A1Q8CNM3_9PSEU|nr:cytochrome P450 [Actinophytocola xanthii]OLF15940.1 hypothetical protein BU204_18705 [Actinophytocola xanthii]
MRPTRGVLDRAAGGLNAVTAPFDPEGYLRRRRARGGDPVIVRVPGAAGRMVVSGDPEAARELFGGPVELFDVPRPNPVEPLLGTGSLIMLSGERHRRERRVLTPPFGGQRMRAYGTIIQEAVLDQVRSWRPGQRLDAQRFGQAVTLSVIVRAVFGVDGGSLGEHFATTTAQLLQGYKPMLSVPALRRTVGRLGPEARLRRRLAAFDSLLAAEIENRRGTGVADREDILSLLLSVRYDDGSELSTSDLLDELRTMVVAGHETTATTLGWALYHLYREPALVRRLIEELAPLGNPPPPAELAELPFLRAVCHEALRLHPVVPMVARRLLAPWRFRGVDLAPGDTAAVATSLLHHNPDVWDEPLTFRPDRFLDREPRGFAFAPFGGGHRRCLGAAFGDYELRIALGTVVCMATLSMPERERGRRIPPAVPRNITFGPRRPLMLTFEGPTGTA